jgi:hypothetical protein
VQQGISQYSEDRLVRLERSLHSKANFNSTAELIA